MTARQQILAHIVTFAALRTKAAGLRTSLDTLGDDIKQYLDDHPDEELKEPSTEISALWRHRSGGKGLRLEGLDDAQILYAARRGMLTGNMKAIAAAERTDPEMVALDSAIVELPGTRYLDVVLPTFTRRKELEEIAAAGALPSAAATTAASLAEAKRPAPAPPPQPAPTPTPIRQAAPAADGQRCPDHGKARHSAKSGGLYCPAKMNDGSWCTWSNVA